ncbi:MAG: hypothetical protein ACFFDT_33535 [Candidatus Hodarchaeota archaeon]
MHETKANKTVFVVVAVALIVSYICVKIRLSGNPFHCSAVQTAQQRRILLLHYTNPEELLKAGREILRQGPKNPKRYVGPMHIDGFPIPRRIRIPKVIKRLSPRASLINFGGYIVLQMQQTTSRRFGVRIFPEGFEAPKHYFNYGHRELIPGLWYYDSNYKKIPQYDKTIDYIIQNGQWIEPNDIDPNENSKKSKKN